ncbi:DUF7144 family membrane protein [Kocuria oceani]|uniref:DUF7144 family membrane protein n=1 Tax=Kocuria oceani TaxID=988827 RepID=UPI004035F5F1
MATTTFDRDTGRQDHSRGAVAGTAAAGIFLVLVGILHVLQGLVALFNDEFYVYGEEYIFTFDMTGWGWTHLIAGVVLAVTGFALIQGALWAHTLAVVLAGLSIVVSFLWMPFYPLWNIVVIAFDAFVIWAVTTRRRELTRS